MARGIDRKQAAQEEDSQEAAPVSASSDPSPELSNVCKHWDRMVPNSPIYTFLFSTLTLRSASHGRVVANITVSSPHMNSKGTLHGVVSSALVDCLGGLAIASTGAEQTGLSTDIHTTYVGGAKEGDELEVVSEVRKMGGSLAFTNVEIKNISRGGAYVATGTHTKYVRK
ncbi:MAG: hypothetical protein LQ351_000725 [Letrouitia transgressa]|nr:MAG: hypothetical protein LQ351_000725 [Letrouitia transgressa]